MGKRKGRKRSSKRRRQGAKRASPKALAGKSQRQPKPHKATAAEPTPRSPREQDAQTAPVAKAKARDGDADLRASVEATPDAAARPDADPNAEPEPEANAARDTEAKPSSTADADRDSEAEPGSGDSEREPSAPAAVPARKKSRRRRGPNRPPPRGFWLGFLYGLLVLPPAFAVCALAMARLGLVAERDGETMLSLGAAFVALPGALTAGGVGRLAVRAVVFGGSVRRASVGAALRLGVAGAALAAILAIAAGPTEDVERWWLVGALGVATGLVCGSVLGGLAGIVARVWLREEKLDGERSASEAH